ncbi:MAG: aminotransferase class V-fold PLP-dependent enzyme [Nocardioidaceae bacterium]
MSATNQPQTAADRVLLDSASGLPLQPAAREVLDAALSHGWADPLRHHHEGRQARLLVDNAREVVATLVGARPDEVSFVSSGTMACQLGVLGLRLGRRRVGTTVVHSAVEHSAVITAAHWACDDEDPSSQSVPVDQVGRIDLAAWEAAVSSPGVAVSCLQAANHEVGTRQPVAAAYDVCRTHTVPLVVDASAALGWVDPPESWDVLAASAHKWGGPAGVGLLAVRKGVRWRAPWPGDEREPTQAGYLNIPGVLAAAAALQSLEAGRRAAADRMHALTSDLSARLATSVPDVDLAGDPDDRVPHIVNASFLYVDGEALVTELDRAGFAVSSGSACTASTLEPSHVLAAMGVLTHGNVRISISPGTTAEELDRFATMLAAIVTRLRNSTGVNQRSADG